MKAILYVLLALLVPAYTFAQRGHGKHYHKHDRQPRTVVHNHNVYVYNSPVKVKRKGPPRWAPAHGYKHRYVYFPEYRCYYDNFQGVYVYRNGTVWVTSVYQPRFIVNIGVTRKVELSIDEAPQPQVYFEQHIVLYR